MKSTSKFMSLVLTVCLVLALIPWTPAQASEIPFTCSYEMVGNMETVITVTSGQSVKVSVDDPSLAEVSVKGSKIYVMGIEGAVGIAKVFIEYGGTAPYEAEIPIGYTTFIFENDKLKVFQGSDSEYEIIGINMNGEQEVTGEALAEGCMAYSNTDEYKLLVSIKKKGGTYVFSGEGNDMALAVKKEASKPARLLLAGLNLKSSFTAPLTIKKDSQTTVTVTALAGFFNCLEDTKWNNADVYGEAADGGDGTNAEYAESAVIKGKNAANVILNGKGVLELKCKSKNAVKIGESGSLTIQDISLYVDSVNHGISSDNTMEILSGNITVNAVGDGIRSDPDMVDAEAGCAGIIHISSGIFQITAGSDGIQAAQNLEIEDGNFIIRTGEGYNDGNFNKDTMSCKGLKASNNSDESGDTSEASNRIEISGGKFELNTADDAVHSDAFIVITGGVFNICTGDDGIHADTSLTLGTENGTDKALKVTVEKSYEGLEAGNVYIYSGIYDVTASDDGINAAGGSDFDDTGDHFNPWGQPGRPGNMGGGTSGTSQYSLNIAGGTVYVNASGDGLDSNGTLNLTGGKIIVWGAQANSDDEPLDCDGTLTIKGATVFAAGSCQMMTTPSNDSQAFVRYGNSGGWGGGSSTAIDEGKTVNVRYNNETVYNIKAIKKINYVLYSAPDMTSSSGWSIVADDSELIEPDTEETEPDTKETEPDTKETEPDTEETEPDTKETEPDTEETEPDTEETEPGTDETEKDTNVSETAGGNPGTGGASGSTAVQNPQQSGDSSVGTVSVKVGKSSIRKVKRSKNNKKALVTLKRVKGVSGYQIRYSISRKYKKKSTKYVTVKKYRYLLKKLKRNKKYYVSVRAYKDVGGTRIYSKWSKSKTIKVR